jgi:hypothetical protein
MPCVFPLEIVETILDLLAEDDEGHSALKTCSLVCNAFLPTCRRHIFESIVLDGKYNTSSPTSHSSSCAFDRLLRQTPGIADYVRKLDYNALFEHSSLESLTRISRLKSLTIRRIDWRKTPIRPALLHLLHLPTLTHVKVTKIKDFVVSDLITCFNLKYLDVGSGTSVSTEDTFPSTLPERSIQLNEFVSGFDTDIMKLYSARRTDGQPIIDFGSLSKLTVEVNLDSPNEAEASRELFRRCHVLTNVNISCK